MRVFSTPSQKQLFSWRSINTFTKIAFRESFWTTFTKIKYFMRVVHYSHENGAPLMKSPFCGSVISSCFLKKQYNLCSVRWLIRRCWIIFPVATVRCERRCPQPLQCIGRGDATSAGFISLSQCCTVSPTGSKRHGHCIGPHHECLAPAAGRPPYDLCLRRLGTGRSRRRRLH